LRKPLLLLLAVLPALLCGCREEAPPSQTPQRIVVLAPSLSETLFALDLGDRVVGVGDYSRWPPEAADKPRLGGLFDPNLERIVALKPDLAVLLPGERELGSKLERLGVATLYIPSETLADVKRAITEISRRCGVPERGERLLAEWRAGLAPQTMPGSPRVLLSVGRRAGSLTDVLVAGPGTFLDELLRRLGGVNVFADAPTLYPQIGLEEVVARAPDIILELRSEPVAPEVAATLVRDWRQLPDLPAVRNGRIEVIADYYALIPGPRLPQLYKEMRVALTRGAR